MLASLGQAFLCLMARARVAWQGYTTCAALSHPV
jgi:hypothetical protein